MLNLSEKKISMSERILSICIPTYNRAIYLTRLLDSLINEIQDNDLPVNIKITNNASIDNTKLICNDFISKYDFIRAVHQSENMGADFNIFTAYSMSDSIFTWVIGDDEYLKPGALLLIVKLLTSDIPKDMIYLSHDIYNEANISNVCSLDYVNFNNKEDFASSVGIYFTFISSFIFKKNIFPLELNKVENNFGSCLVQLLWIYGVLLTSNYFIFIRTKVFFAEPDNSSGYKFYEVFSRNYCNIVDDYFSGDNSFKEKLKLFSLYFLVGHTCNLHTRDNFGDSSSAKHDLDYAFNCLWQYKFFYKHAFYHNWLKKPVLFFFKVCRKIRNLLIK